MGGNVSVHFKVKMSRSGSRVFHSAVHFGAMMIDFCRFTGPSCHWTYVW